jgi:hypothetical protein
MSGPLLVLGTIQLVCACVPDKDDAVWMVVIAFVSGSLVHAGISISYLLIWASVRTWYTYPRRLVFRGVYHLLAVFFGPASLSWLYSERLSTGTSISQVFHS